MKNCVLTSTKVIEKNIPRYKYNYENVILQTDKKDCSKGVYTKNLSLEMPLF